MPFQVRTEARAAAGGLDGTVYLLEGEAAGAWAEVWPAFGFNCYRWLADQGTRRDLLYADPNLFNNSKPTRSGIPILFPFPNRIRGGRFTWAGKEYALPKNDSTSENAIHGFPCRKPWRVAGHGSSRTEAWVTGEFQFPGDAPESAGLWPAEFVLRVTYRLRADSLRIEAEVHNPDVVPLPFGLGYHPYFRVPLSPGVRPEEHWAQVPATSIWELQDSLPTGNRPPVDAARDLNRPRRFPEINVDDVLTGVPCAEVDGDNLLVFRGALRTPESPGVEVWTSPSFREMVIFTPTHRQAICLEPYTCTTDAINLQRQGVDAGLRILPAGSSWSSVVELRV